MKKNIKVVLLVIVAIVLFAPVINYSAREVNEEARYTQYTQYKNCSLVELLFMRKFIQPYKVVRSYY